MIKLENITKKYNNDYVLMNVNVSLDTNKKNIIVGINGGGKTTMVNIISKVDFLFSGKVTGNENVFTCFSDDYLPNYSTLNNLVKYYKLNVAKYERYLKKLNFTESNKIYKSLSFGNKQKFKLIFTLLQENKFLIFDEPTNGLDILSIKNFIEIINKELQGVLIVSHDFYLIENIVEKLYLLKNQELHFCDYNCNVIEYLNKVISYE